MILFIQFKNSGIIVLNFWIIMNIFFLLAPVISNNFVPRSRRKNQTPVITGQ